MLLNNISCYVFINLFVVVVVVVVIYYKQYLTSFHCCFTVRESEHFSISANNLSMKRYFISVSNVNCWTFIMRFVVSIFYFNLIFLFICITASSYSFSYKKIFFSWTQFSVCHWFKPSSTWLYKWNMSMRDTHVLLCLV